MPVILFFKACLIWLVIAILAVVNGAFRDFMMAPYLGEANALPISGISLSVIVFVVTYFSSGLFGKQSKLAYLLIGVQWVVMTLLFEFMLGRIAGDKAWPEIFQVFNMANGNLFTLVLATSLASPLLVARIKTLI